jgi:hypothetical protein
LAEETTASLNQLSARLDKRRAAGASSPAVSTPAATGVADDRGVPTPPAEAEMAAVAVTATDQRRCPRWAYRYRQSIAAMTDDGLPAQGGFFEVECWDISACGFSFFMDQLPKFETFVAALGRPPLLTHFAARVVRVARMACDGVSRYLVGCDFINRVNLPKTRV